MIPDLAPNTMARPYRGLSVQEVDVPLTEASLVAFLLGREVYRRSDFLALRHGGATALVAVRREPFDPDVGEPLFSPVAEVRVLAGPDEVAWIESPATDVGNASALARVAVAHARPGLRAYLVQGRYQHVNFIWEPRPVRVRVTEVVPPEPPKLFALAEQVVAYDEDLPPIDLVLDAVDIGDLAAAHPAERYLVPCRGSGVDVGAAVDYLDTRPATRRDWLLIGCERSLQFHRHFYGDEPERVDICPRRRVSEDGGAPTLTLTKCCLLERGIEVDGTTAVVPWGSNLDEIRQALRLLTGVDAPSGAEAGPCPGLAEEQAALRRVATLVACGRPPEVVFAAVTEEVGRLVGVDLANMCRYDPDGTVTFVASWGSGGESFPIGSRWTLGGQNLGTLVFETGRPARIDSYADASGPLSVAASEWRLRSAVGTPIIVEGRLWGMMGAGSTVERPLPPGIETRLSSFTELVAAAIANAESRAALAASRARIVAAGDESRRRIERDLHDGAQQRLISLGLELRGAQAMVPPQLGELAEHLVRMGDELASASEELQEICRGLHPAVLSAGGLEPALGALARRSALPVKLDLHAARRLPEPVEVAAYYAVSEALTNAAKHAEASVVSVELDERDKILTLAISDDGIGGADPARGSGLVGLSDRIEALGGTLEVRSPAGHGTTVLIEVPVGG
ncbi:MAG TPA: GAF domain-containing sensor histidine kinase [Acidimicrobiia bacterium]|nr:GAF domain-containing sensor histidine kinase [Acidimicrobiia bacterium]